MSQTMNVKRIFAKLEERFNPAQANGLDAVFQFAVDDADSFYFQVNNQVLNANWGEHKDPNITLRLSEETLAQVVAGELDGMSAFMRGKLRAEGDVILATRLGKLFRH